MKSPFISNQAEPSSYHPLIGAVVTDQAGTRSSIRSVHQNGDATLALLETGEGNRQEIDLSELERHEDGFYLARALTHALQDGERQGNRPLKRHENGWSQTEANLRQEDNHRIDEADYPSRKEDHRHHDADQREITQPMTIPVTQEEINVATRRVETGKGLHVRKHVLEHEEIVSLPRVEEILSVQHVQVGTIVSEGNLPQARHEGDTYIIPVFEETYILEKRIRLKEEIHIVRRHRESSEEQKVKLRSEQVSVERFDEQHGT